MRTPFTPFCRQRLCKDTEVNTALNIAGFDPCRGSHRKHGDISNANSSSFFLLNSPFTSDFFVTCSAGVYCPSPKRITVPNAQSISGPLPQTNTPLRCLRKNPPQPQPHQPAVSTTDPAIAGTQNTKSSSPSHRPSWTPAQPTYQPPRASENATARPATRCLSSTSDSRTRPRISASSPPWTPQPNSRTIPALKR